MNSKYNKELSFANAFYKMYSQQFGEIIDEMKLHKLMYFLQRESLIQTGTPLFEEQFEGWKYGPVLISVRKAYQQHIFDKMPYMHMSGEVAAIMDKIFQRYAGKESWSLSRITHGEYSWMQSRKGLVDGDNGNAKMLIDDIRVDAERVKSRRAMRRSRNLE